MKWENIFSCHINRTWNGRDPKTTRSNDANLVLFNTLRINPMWLNYEDVRTAHLFVGWIGKHWEHHELLSVELYPRRELRLPWLRKAFKRTVNFWKIRKLIREIEALEAHAEAVCSDPMNGCPGDFRHDFDRRLMWLDAELQKLRH